MKNILYILFSICLLTACSSDDENGVKEPDSNQEISKMLKYSFGTPKESIQYDEAVSSDLLIKKRVYTDSPIIFYHLKDSKLTMISHCYSRFAPEGNNEPFLREINKLNPPKTIEIKTEGSGLTIVQDSLSWINGNYKILIRNGRPEPLPESYNFMIIEYKLVN